jgi:protein deglycase
MSLSVLVLLSDGFEEIEVTCPVDLLRRAGATVIMASCQSSLEVTGRSRICIKADHLLSEVENPTEFDLLVLPGGPAVFELRKRQEIISLIFDFANSGRPMGAICAAPLLLMDAQLLDKKQNYTAHISTIEELPLMIKTEAVVECGQFITSQGAGTALEFGLRLIRRLYGHGKEEEIRNSIHAPPYSTKKFYNQ